MLRTCSVHKIESATSFNVQLHSLVQCWLFESKRQLTKKLLRQHFVLLNQNTKAHEQVEFLDRVNPAEDWMPTCGEPFLFSSPVTCSLSSWRVVVVGLCKPDAMGSWRPTCAVGDWMSGAKRCQTLFVAARFCFLSDLLISPWSFRKCLGCGIHSIIGPSFSNCAALTLQHSSCVNYADSDWFNTLMSSGQISQKWRRMVRGHWTLSYWTGLQSTTDE